jgi:hypothetical protein
MKVLAEKRKELSQTIVSLIGSLRTEKGCLRCDFCQGMEGAMNLLQEPYEMLVHTVAAGKDRTEARFPAFS